MFCLIEGFIGAAFKFAELLLRIGKSVFAKLPGFFYGACNRGFHLVCRIASGFT
ncbi:MAG: hypothetical protein JWL90_4042 [Chthoniobacteraceae bacterium]|nr:hypothetical protein [Chthoniobacteraceae bacterium]